MAPQCTRQPELRLSMLLLCRFPVPLNCFLLLLRSKRVLPVARLVLQHRSDSKLRLRVALDISTCRDSRDAAFCFGPAPGDGCNNAGSITSRRETNHKATRPSTKVSRKRAALIADAAISAVISGLDGFRVAS